MTPAQDHRDQKNNAGGSRNNNTDSVAAQEEARTTILSDESFVKNLEAGVADIAAGEVVDVETLAHLFPPESRPQ